MIFDIGPRSEVINAIFANISKTTRDRGPRGNKDFPNFSQGILLACMKIYIHIPLTLISTARITYTLARLGSDWTPRYILMVQVNHQAISNSCYIYANTHVLASCWHKNKERHYQEFFCKGVNICLKIYPGVRSDPKNPFFNNVHFKQIEEGLLVKIPMWFPELHT